LGDDVLTSSGHVKVNPTMQLSDRPHIFAAGDVVEWNEQKSARKAYPQSQVVVQNILTLLRDPKATSLKSYWGRPEALPLTNGKVRSELAVVSRFDDSRVLIFLSFTLRTVEPRIGVFFGA
jgi:NADH dehydrogenase FAD-containing subunit